jgi:hypothetical protein
MHSLKNARRIEACLPVMTEDTHQVCKLMRASSPPASAADLIDQHQQIRRTLRTTKKVRHYLSSNLSESHYFLTYLIHVTLAK